jgi:hypothetical protein
VSERWRGSERRFTREVQRGGCRNRFIELVTQILGVFVSQIIRYTGVSHEVLNHGKPESTDKTGLLINAIVRP